MKKVAFWLILGCILGAVVGAFAVVVKYESESPDAGSTVGYGKSGADIIRLKVTSDGTVQIQ